jgi:hypothetical protein
LRAERSDLAAILEIASSLVLLAMTINALGRPARLATRGSFFVAEVALQRGKKDGGRLVVYLQPPSSKGGDERK